MPLGQNSHSPDRKEKSKSPFSSFGGRGRSKEHTSSSLAPPQQEPANNLRQSALREEDAAPRQPEDTAPTSEAINGAAEESLGRAAFTDGAGSSTENRLQEPLQPVNTAPELEVS